MAFSHLFEKLMVYHADYTYSWTGSEDFKIMLSHVISEMAQKVFYLRNVVFCFLLKKFLGEIGRLKILLQGASWRKYKINLNQYAVNRKKCLISVDSSITHEQILQCQIVWQVGRKQVKKCWSEGWGGSLFHWEKLKVWLMAKPEWLSHLINIKIIKDV